jgi:hypothetical protein
MRHEGHIKTIEPLSKNCGEPIDTSFANQDYAALAHEFAIESRYDGKLVLTCWHHGNIPSSAAKNQTTHALAFMLCDLVTAVEYGNTKDQRRPFLTSYRCCVASF